MTLPLSSHDNFLRRQYFLGWVVGFSLGDFADFLLENRKLRQWLIDFVESRDLFTFYLLSDLQKWKDSVGENLEWGKRRRICVNCMKLGRDCEWDCGTYRLEQWVYDKLPRALRVIGDGLREFLGDESVRIFQMPYQYVSCGVISTSYEICIGMGKNYCVGVKIETEEDHENSNMIKMKRKIDKITNKLQLDRNIEYMLLPS